MFKLFEEDIGQSFIYPKEIQKKNRYQAYYHMISKPLTIKDFRKIRYKEIKGKLGFNLVSKNPDTKYSTEIAEIPSNLKFGQHDNYSFFEIYARETIFQLFKYPLMSFYKFAINLDYNTEFKKIFNWVEYKKERNKGIGNKVNIIPMKNKKKKDQLKEIENNVDSLPSYLYDNVFEEVVDDYKFIKSEKTRAKAKNLKFKALINDPNLEETDKNENRARNAGNAGNARNAKNVQFSELSNRNESNVEQSETSIERQTERESEFENNRSELTSEYEMQYRTEPERKKQKKNVKNNIHSDQEINLEKHNNWLNTYYKKRNMPKSINKIFITRKEKKFRSRLLSDGDIPKINFETTIKGDFDFLIHSLEGNVLTEVLTDEEISPFIFYGNFELKSIRKYDIIGEIKESSDSHLNLIDQARKYIQLIYNLRRSKRLNDNLGFKKENEKILMYVFNNEYQKFITNILDFRINRDKFKEMERYKELKSYQNILKDYGLHAEANENIEDALIKKKELNSENKILNMQKNGENKENKISDVDNVGKGANKEIKSTIELYDFKNMNESKGSNNDKGNEENSININRQKNLLMNLIIESNVPFVFMFIQNLVGYEKVQERTKQNLQKEIQDMKEKMANQKKEMQEEMEKKLLTQKKEMQEEMDKKIEELNKTFVTFMNEMKKSTSQTMNTNEQTTDNVKK